jgi:hypothetical protein
VTRSIIIFAIGITLVGRIASACVGETLEQCEARYGKKTHVGGDAFKFEKNGTSIIVQFVNHRSVRELFTLESGQNLTEGRVIGLLNENSGGASWKTRVENVAYCWRKYERADRAAVAIYVWAASPNGKVGKLLEIRSWKESVPKKPSDSGL